MGTWTILGFLLANSVLPAATIWYNGDFDGREAIANELNTVVADARVYDNVVLSSPVTVTGIKAWIVDDSTSPISIVGADYEIRQGVSAGDGGSLVSSGTTNTNFTWTDTGLDFVFNNIIYNFMVLEFTGLNVNLTFGEYWLMLRPEGTGSGRAFLATTSGTNFIGYKGNDGQSFLTGPMWVGSPFVSTEGLSAVLFDGKPADFMLGLEGTTIPEPGTRALAGMSLIGLCLYVAKRSKKEGCAKQIGNMKSRLET
jgi:hypothetical protein